MWNRRDVLKFGSAFLAMNGTSHLHGSAFATTLYEGNGARLRTVSDGHLTLPMSFVFPNVPQDELQLLLAANGLDTETVQPECNLTLLEQGGRIVLFDAGSGPNFMSSAGKLFEQLEILGVDPSSITDVVFTHGHPDHLWGIIDDFDEIAFPNAALHFPLAEWEFWTSDDAITQLPESRQSFAVGAKNRLDLMKDQVMMFDPGDEIISGLEAFDTSGHTPGHCAFVIHSGDETTMIIGDALTNSIISFEKPNWPSGSDQDPGKGVVTRNRLLDRLANEKMQIIGYHLPNGGVGRVEAVAGSYRFIQD